MDFPNEISQYFKNKTLEIKLIPESKVIQFERLDLLYDYFEKEKDFWNFDNVTKNGILNQLFQIPSNISQMITNLSEKGISIPNWQTTVDNIVRESNNKKYVHSKTTFGKLLKELSQATVDVALGAYRYFTEEVITQSNNALSQKLFKGAVKAFYLIDGKNTVSKKSKLLLDKLSDAENSILQSEQNLITQSKDTFDKLTRSSDEFQKNLTAWKGEFTNTTNAFNKEKQEEIDSLIKQYKQQLMLEAPVDYWEQNRKEYEEKGKKWKCWAIGTAITTLVSLFCVLYNMPTILKQSITESGTIRGTIIFALIVSVLVYFIRLFTKLSISAYHLSRDAQERKQLTYVYLALFKDNKVDEKEREIVLQSIFSRSDTGLLKDSNPTLPNGLDAIIKNFRQ